MPTWNLLSCVSFNLTIFWFSGEIVRVV
ncbi:unnamed protein product [Oikopleura dioica]|uniref:Uncharacterized protein n=1 Tax=Oikopleura dioica TaxID=34765 RepID=E4XCD9_OIKDI|nr:unnamed protein product [Oikopleura dioica]